MRFLVRVDDVGRLPGDDPERGTDRLLHYFRRWRDAIGCDLQAVYGIVPAWVDQSAVDALVNVLADGEVIAQHGWDHRRGRVSLEQMSLGLQALGGCRAYIPPFNAYDVLDLHNWKLLGGSAVLGGFYGEHHSISVQPLQYGGVWHIPASRAFYGRARELVSALNHAEDFEGVQVLTLHVPWDVGFDGLRELGESLRGRTVSLNDFVRKGCV